MVIVRILWMSLLVLQIIVFLEIRNLLCGLTHSDWWRELLWVYILYEGHLVLFAHRRHRHMRDDDDDYLIVIRLGQYFGVLLPALFYRNSDYFEVDLRYLPSIDRTVGGSVGRSVGKLQSIFRWICSFSQSSRHWMYRMKKIDDEIWFLAIAKSDLSDRYFGCAFWYIKSPTDRAVSLNYSHTRIKLSAYISVCFLLSLFHI